MSASTESTKPPAAAAEDSSIVQYINVGGRTIKVEGTVNLKFTEVVDKPQPEPDKPPVPPGTTEPTKPTEGTVKKGGWGANMDPKTWVRTVMKDPATEFKVTDGSKNVATNFKTAESADNFIVYFQRHPEQVSTFFDIDTDDNDNGEVHNEDFKGEDNPKDIMVGPYGLVQGSQQLGSTVRGPTIRHYKSGKPDDWTIERNTKGIPYPNHQAIIKTTFPKKLEHDDNWSVKGGGDHMTNGWYDFGIGLETGQSCGGIEPEHPDTDLCIIKGPKVGSLLGKTCYMAFCWWHDQNLAELWFKEKDTDPWKKLVEGANVGGFKSKANGKWEIQQRIDGFFKDDPPHIHWMVVQQIEPKK